MEALDLWNNKSPFHSSTDIFQAFFVDLSCVLLLSNSGDTP
jgi:hypothetical protein